MTVSPTVRIRVSGARGESQADVLRRTGQYGVLPTDTDEQAMAKLNAAAEAAAVRSEAAAAAADVDAQTAAMAEQSVLDNLADIDKTSALQFQAVSRGALAAINDRFDGMQAYLSEKGREGTFIWTPGDQSAIVAADPRQGVSVAPSSNTTGAGGAWLRRYQGLVYASWFGAVADGSKVGGTWAGTDNGPPIQAALDHLAVKGGGTLFFRDGIHIVSSPIQADAESPAQILLPRNTFVTDAISIKLLGETPPDNQVQQSGAILQSVLPAGTTGALIGGSAGGQHGCTWLTLRVENLGLRLPQNSAMRGLDAEFVQALHLENVRVDVPDAVTRAGGFVTQTTAEPTYTTNFGIVGPANDIPIWNIWNNVQVWGMYWGIFPGELASGNGIAVTCCKWPMLLGNYRHASKFDWILFTSSPNGVYVDGFGEVHIDMLDIERTPPNTGAPAWVAPYGVDIYDPSNAWRGSVRIHMHDPDPASTPPGELYPRINGARNLDWRYIIPPDGTKPTFNSIFAGFEDIVDRHSLHEIYSKTRTPWRSDTAEQKNVNGPVAAWSGANAGNGRRDYRIGQITYVLDGALDRGKVVFSTARDGTVMDHWQIGSQGNLRRLTPWPVAADDTAAGALGLLTGTLYKDANGFVRVKS